MMTAEQYRKSVETILDLTGGNYVQVKLSVVRALYGNWNAAGLLSYFSNLIRMKNANPKDRKRLRKDDMWFVCPVGRIRKDTGMGDRRCRTTIAQLVEKGCVKTERRWGNRLWVRLNRRKLARLAKIGVRKLRTAETAKRSDGLCGPQDQTLRTAGTETANRKNPYTKKPTKRSTKESHSQRRGESRDSVRDSSALDGDTPRLSRKGEAPSPSREDGSARPPKGKADPRSSDRTTPFARNCARRLWRKVREDFPDQVDPRSNLGKWAAEFAQLERERGRERVREILDSHIDHMGTWDDLDPYWPAAYSADSFRKKWARIADAGPRAAKKAKANREAGKLSPEEQL